MQQVPYKYDYLVFIGRFQPFHNGHEAVAEQAFKLAHRVIFLLGSASSARTPKNPWNAPERKQMILGTFHGKVEPARILLNPLRDFINDDLWVAEVQKIVSELVAATWQDEMVAPRIGIIGQNKDESSYYLKKFPQWGEELVTHTETLDATELREYLFEANQSNVHGGMSLIHSNVPDPVFQMVDAFRHNSKVFPALHAEYEYYKGYRKPYENLPYEVKLVTTDAVVIKSGHILLVQRKSLPGKGLWALPGGFLAKGKTLQQNFIKELREETKLKVPENVLLGSLKGPPTVVDDPNRSLRGRVLTHVYKVDLGDGELPDVKGASDAKKAKFVTFDEFRQMSHMMFEDHYHIGMDKIGLAY